MTTALQSETRSERGKNLARRLRRNGRLPGVVYGDSGGKAGRDAVAVSVDPATVSQILHSDSGVNTLIGLTIDSGKPNQVLIKDFQLHPVTRELLHVDFFRVAMDRVITVTVPFVLKGEAEGVKMQGGLIAFEQREFAVECLPTEIPEHVEVDVSSLMIGQGVRVRDVIEGVAWKPVTDIDTLIVHVVAPKVEEEPEAEEEEAAAEAGEAAEGEKVAAESDEAGKKTDE
ncbi:MAG: 50S ribosomal protein L25 [Acidobacteria bacterium]|nr:50S ribosomal protein L25 [Acidobacteriota bacterium]MDP7338983.1 50S ribosomal protein L25 [Vicinamibacterales bacterium]MDP7478814.1 50S ribosomal protein L25 [Vicinamibacterales bacterium]MDP7692382.1 50S ribosomal protein L25 [Vicinamibacterales bacterium]HJN43255.1 50S ribosomal protein L25 [Vicinamibacterales bacterium]